MSVRMTARGDRHVLRWILIAVGASAVGLGLLWFALLACQGQFVATSAPQALTGAAWPRGAVMESEVGSVFA